MWTTFSPEAVLTNVRQLIPANTITTNIACANSGLLLMAILRWIFEELKGDDSSELAKFLIELIVAGADPQAIQGRKTHTLRIVALFWIHGESRLRRTLVKWLQLLSEAGVDLVKFGRVENFLSDDYQVDWTFYEDIAAKGQSEYWFHCEILGLWFGETPAEFHIVLEDLWFLNPLAADFWRWVECDPMDDGEEALAVPGAWCEE
jgi:hypothetical protein